jgi:hypothetical protein
MICSRAWYRPRGIGSPANAAMISGRPPRRFRPPIGRGEVLRLTTLTVRGRQASVRLEYFRQD